MPQYIVILIAIIIIFGLMMISLKLGKYKERSSGCCGGSSCKRPSGKDEQSCST